MRTAEPTTPPQRDAASQLVELLPGLEIIACRALGNRDDARDAVQEVMARALAALEGGRTVNGPLPAFVHGIAMHVIADIHRARARTTAAPAPALEFAATEQASALEALIDDEERVVLAAAIATLSHDDQQLLRRCFVAGEQVAAIARSTGEREDRVRKRKSRALGRLREALRAAGHVLRNHTTRTT